jgi:hypothetical protein
MFALWNRDANRRTGYLSEQGYVRSSWLLACPLWPMRPLHLRKSGPWLPEGYVNSVTGLRG